MPIITISRQYGSGGSEVAQRVAKALGWAVFDNEVVEQVAARLGLTAAEVSAREERVSSLAERMASALAMGIPEVMPVVGDIMSQPNEERLVEMTRLVMEEASRSGPAVLVGRGAQAMLAESDDALHVYCYASFDALVRYAIAHLGASPDDAPRVVRDVNRHREQYVKRHWHRDWRDFTNYDVCLNTARLGLDGSAATIIEVARRRFG